MERLSVNAQTTSVLINEFLRLRFPGLASGQPKGDTQLLASGAVDSLGILELVTFLAEKFGIRVEDEDFEPATFETVAHLVRFVERKRAA